MVWIKQQLRDDAKDNKRERKTIVSNYSRIGIDDETCWVLVGFEMWRKQKLENVRHARVTTREERSFVTRLRWMRRLCVDTCALGADDHRVGSSATEATPARSWEIFQLAAPRGGSYAQSANFRRAGLFLFSSFLTLVSRTWNTCFLPLHHIFSNSFLLVVFLLVVLFKSNYIVSRIAIWLW